MSNLMKPAAQWWGGLSPREHVMLGILGLVAGAVLLWFAIVSPLLGWRAEGLESLAAARRDAAFVESAVAEAASLGSIRHTPAPADMRASISESAARHGIPISRLQPEATGGINIWIDGITPALLYGWLTEMDATYGVGVARATLSPGDGEGSLKAQLLLTAANP